MTAAARATAILAFGILAGCGAPHAVAPPVPPPAGAACFDALAAGGAAFDLVGAPATRGGCGIADGVALQRARAAIAPAALMSCPLALRLDEFDQSVVQPAARRHFGRPVAAIHQIGAYSCRLRTGGSGRLSEHASGRAIDIAAFEVDGGPRVVVKQHWRDPGPRGAFLREVAREACMRFSVVLTPNHDVWHADHLHLDLGRHPLCGY